LPPKLKDPDNFSIPCVIGNETIERSMCDLRARVSLMPLSLFERFGLRELKPTNMTLQLANRSIIIRLEFLGIYLSKYEKFLSRQILL